jgi:hypothetical protein
MYGQRVKASRRRERGVTLVITAIGIVSMLSMLVLAIDVVTLYVSAGEAQKAADAAALAGAKVFVSSGFTSGQLGPPTAAGPQNLVCNGSTGLSDLQAQAAARQNLIAGTAPTTVTTSCIFSPPENPEITVAVTRTGLPMFFARIWGAGANRVSRTAKAEAYNPSGSTVPVQVKSVKPWLIPNCDPAISPPCTPYFVDPAANYALHNPAAYIGQFFKFRQRKNPPTANEYYALDLVPQATDCPSSLALPGSCTGLGPAYHDNIACANNVPMSCGDTVNVNPNTGTMLAETTAGTQCLIHTDDHGNPPNSCTTDADPDCFLTGPPVSISGGLSNPNPAMRVPNISRSDSVVTVPIFDYQNPANNPCPGGVCGTATVIGFLQLGIQSISLPPAAGPPAGQIGAVVLNAVGCAASGAPPVSGGGVSPIPVRLVN